MRIIPDFKKITSHAPRREEISVVYLPAFINADFHDFQLKVNFRPLSNLPAFPLLTQKYYGFARRKVRRREKAV